MFYAVGPIPPPPAATRLGPGTPVLHLPTRDVPGMLSALGGAGRPHSPTLIIDHPLLPGETEGWWAWVPALAPAAGAARTAGERAQGTGWCGWWVGGRGSPSTPTDTPALYLPAVRRGQVPPGAGEVVRAMLEVAGWGGAGESCGEGSEGGNGGPEVALIFADDGGPGDGAEPSLAWTAWPTAVVSPADAFSFNHSAAARSFRGAAYAAAGLDVPPGPLERECAEEAHPHPAPPPPSAPRDIVLLLPDPSTGPGIGNAAALSPALGAVAADVGLGFRVQTVAPGQGLADAVCAVASARLLVGRAGTALAAHAALLPPGSGLLALMPHNWAPADGRAGAAVALCTASDDKVCESLPSLRPPASAYASPADARYAMWTAAECVEAECTAAAGRAALAVDVDAVADGAARLAFRLLDCGEVWRWEGTMGRGGA